MRRGGERGRPMGPAIIIGVVIGVIVLIAFVMVGMYNGLVRSRNRVGEAWSGIDVQLRRRGSLIPNLVETVKGYAEHEREPFAVAENYPELKASQNFMELQTELSDIEEKIAFARQFYNQNVLAYNNGIQTFPNALMARNFGF